MELNEKIERRGGPRMKTRDDDRRGIGNAGYSFDGKREGQAPLKVTPEHRRQVFAMAKILPDRSIAIRMGWSLSSLYRHCRREIDEGRAEAMGVAGSKLYAAVLRGEPWAVKFFIARYEGNPRLNNLGDEDDAPKYKFDFANYTIEQLNVLESVLDQFIDAAANDDQHSDSDGGEGAIEGGAATA